jgi:hypothetical protein
LEFEHGRVAREIFGINTYIRDVRRLGLAQYAGIWPSAVGIRVSPAARPSVSAMMAAAVITSLRTNTFILAARHR